jgi:hypothetical protein
MDKEERRHARPNPAQWDITKSLSFIIYETNIICMEMILVVVGELWIALVH